MNQILSPLAKKLQLKAGKSWLFYNAPANYPALIEPLPEDTKIAFSPEGNFDGIQLFVVNNEDLINSLKVIQPLLKPETVFWIAYPKKSSGIKSDLEMMGSWDEPGKYGLRVVTAASIDDTWTALRFKPVEQTQTSDTCNTEIRNNEYAAYIDVDNKQIKLPAEIQTVFSKITGSNEFLRRLIL